MADNGLYEHADNVLFYTDDDQNIFTDHTQGDNEVDTCTKAKIKKSN